MKNFSQSLNNPVDDSSGKRSSSQKIDLLYLQFQNLKARIHTSTSKRKEALSNNPSLVTKQSYQRKTSNLIKQQKVRDIHSQNLFNKSEAALDYSSQFFKIGEQECTKLNKETIQLKYLIRKSIEAFISNYLCRFQSQVALKIENWQRKLKLSEQTIKKVKMILSIKKSNRQKVIKIEPASTTSNNQAIYDVVLQYQKKINELIEDYQQRIQAAQQKGKDKETFSSTIRSRQTNSHEKEIMQKQTEINKLKLSYHKLKRSYEQTKDKYENSLVQIQQMELKACIGKDKSVQAEQSLVIISSLQQKISVLQEEVSLKDNQIQKLKEIINNFNEKCEKQQVLKVQLTNSSRGMANNQLSNIPVTQICQKPKDQQFYTELEQIEADLSIFNEKFTKSQIIQPKRKKQMFESLKSLELEVNLISEENKHLQSKKALFQNQLKNTQVDQERFVQQNSLLKSEIKRLNNSLQLLDKIVYQFMKDGKFDNCKIEELPQELKSKGLFSDFGKQNHKKK